MAISLDAVTRTAGGATNPITWNHTCSGSNRCLIVAVGTNGEDAKSVLYNGAAMTGLGTTQENATGYRVSLWKMTAPSTGSNQVKASFSGAPAYSVMALSFTGVDQTNSTGTYGATSGNAATSNSLSISSTSTDVVVDAIVWNQALNPSTESAGPQQTAQGGAATGNFVRCAASTESGSASVAMSWGLTSATNLTHAGISLRPTSSTTISGISFATQAQAANSAASTVITITKPSGVATGDTMLAALTWEGNMTTIGSVPTGWTSILTTSAGASVSDASGLSMATYYKIAGSEGASYTWSLSGAAVVNSGFIWRITGAHATTPFDASTGNSGQGSQASADFATTNYNDEMVCFLAAYNSSQTGFSFTQPTGYTLHTDIETANNIHYLGVEKIQAGAGTAGATFALGNNAVASDWWIVQVVTFRPPTTSPDARQFGMDCFPVAYNRHRERQYTMCYVGWLNKDVSADVLLPAGPFWHTDLHPKYAFEKERRTFPGFHAAPLSPNSSTPTTPGTGGAISGGPRISLPPPTLTDSVQWQRQAASWMQEINVGHLQNTGMVTLQANSNTTTVSDERVGANSYIDFMPTTANAALEKSGGTLFVSSRNKQSFTITHSNNAQTDRTFVYTILG